MKAPLAIRAVRLVIRCAAAVGALAAIAGAWWTVAAMAMVVAGQFATLHVGQRSLEAPPAADPVG